MSKTTASAIEAKLTAMGLTLPPAPAPVANYVPTHVVGNLLFISGQISRDGAGKILSGKLGAGVTVEQGREAARVCALNLLAQTRAALGSLDRIARIVKLTGFVNAAPTFTDHPAVMNGCSDLLVAVFGDRGKHARAALGMASLPRGAVVEIEMIVEVQ